MTEKLHNKNVSEHLPRVDLSVGVAFSPLVLTSQTRAAQRNKYAQISEHISSTLQPTLFSDLASHHHRDPSRAGVGN